MKVRFRFLTGDVNWSEYGGTWISQKFNNGIDYWLIREIINWEERGEPHPDGKYTVVLATIRPEDYSQEVRDSAIRTCFGDAVDWFECSEEHRVEALYQTGCYITEEEWTGNNYSRLFKECQEFAEDYVVFDKAVPPVDFSKLPETLLVVVEKNRFGHLEVAPKSHRHDHNIAAATVDGEITLYCQVYYEIADFVHDRLPLSKQKELEGGWRVTIRMSLTDYLGLLNAPSYAYAKYLNEAKERSRPVSLPNLFAEINGIPIYHVHKEGYGIGRETDFWYSTAQSPEELHYDCSFRVDELDPECRVRAIGDEPVSASWNRFQEHCKSAIAQALRDNKLKLAPTSDAAVLGGASTSDAPPQAVVLGATSQCSHPNHIQFCQDMAKAGIPVTIKSARMLWYGPVAECEDISHIMSKTQIPCIWDESGKRGFNVYPKAYIEERLVKAIARFDDSSFREELAMHLRLPHPLKGIAQNLIDQLAPYFPEEIKQA